MIPKAKVEGLRQALDKGEVRFKNGSVVRRLDSGKFPIQVVREAGGVACYPDDDSGLLSAYAMALRGPQPKKQPSGDGSKYGDEAPW